MIFLHQFRRLILSVLDLIWRDIPRTGGLINIDPHNLSEHILRII